MATRILVVGGGYGGMTLAKRLASQQIDVTLIDRNPYHTILTEIHQVAAGHRAPETLELPYTTIPGLHILQATMTGLDYTQRQVLTTEGPVDYDILVLALGSIDTDYGVPGVKDYAMTLHSIQDALAIRDQLETLPDQAMIVVAGGGLTGVELAAVLGQRFARSGTHIKLVEATPSLLPSLPESLQHAATERLTALGVSVLRAKRIARIEPDHVQFADDSQLPFDLMVWACGVKANPLLQAVGIPTDRAGRALVDPNYLTQLPGIYVIGDCAASSPPTAQAALQQGEGLADHLVSLLKGQPHLTAPIKNLGTLVDLGHTYGVGTVGPLKLDGWLPALIKRINVARWIWKANSLSGALRYFFGRDDRA